MDNRSAGSAAGTNFAAASGGKPGGFHGSGTRGKWKAASDDSERHGLSKDERWGHSEFVSSCGKERFDVPTRNDEICWECPTAAHEGRRGKSRCFAALSTKGRWFRRGPKKYKEDSSGENGRAMPDLVEVGNKDGVGGLVAARES